MNRRRENPWNFYVRATACKGFLALFLALLPASLFAQATQRESFRGREVVAGEVIVRFRNSTLPASATAGVSDIVTVRALMPSRAMLLRSRSRSVEQLLQEYSGRTDVVYAEPNYLWRKEDLPNDQFFDSQWALRNTGQFVSTQSGTAGADIRAVAAWDIAQGSRSFVIGVVDSGIDYNHPDLAANMWSAPAPFTVVVAGASITCGAGTHGFNAITRTCDPMDDEVERHGTHVAGIIGAAGDNGLGITGVNRVASMMALKFIDTDGRGSTADAIAAIEFAIQAKAVLGASANIRILNGSWGNTFFSQAMLDAINNAAGADMLFVASAGNTATDTDITPHYPSSFDASNILSVAATDNRDALHFLSNFGASSVDLGAPGRDIGSARSVMTYAYETGTSMAAAMVSGAAGLVLSGCTLTSDELKATLLGSVDPIPVLSSRTLSGGRLNVQRALENCAGAPPGFTLKSASPFLLGGASGSAAATISMTPLNGFSSAVALTISAPPDFTVSLGSPALHAGSPSTGMTVTVGANVAPGAYPIYVTGAGGGVTRTAGITLIIGNPISPGEHVVGSWSMSTSQPDRLHTGNGLPPGLADWYQLVLNATSFVDISLYFPTPHGNGLRLLDSSGTVLRQRTSAGSSNIQSINGTFPPGVYFIAASTGLAGDSSYLLAVNAPLLVSLNPNLGGQGTSVQVQLSGAQFAPDLTVDAGSDITVTNVVYNNLQAASATFSVPANAARGPRDVRVRTAAGWSNAVVFTVTGPPPVITSITPASVVVGTTVDIVIVGAHFTDATVQVLSSGTPLTLENVTVVSDTMITARLTVPAVAQVGAHSIQVTNAAGGTSASFQVLPLPPTVTSINPSSGTLGSTVFVTFNGSNFFGPLTFGTGGGITATNVSQTPSMLTVRFDIAPTAALGIRNITVTTTGGTSGAVEFTVTPAPPPTLMSINPSQAGRNTAQILDVRGTNFTTGFTFDAGPDITVANVEIVSLTRANVSIQIGAAAALGPRAVRVSTAGGTSNSLDFNVLPPPPTLISISPSAGAQQTSVSVTLTGTDFTPGLTIQAAGLGVSQITFIDSTSATALISIPASFLTGDYNVTITTLSGRSAPVVFTVLPGAPTLTGISPSYGVRGRDNRILFTGTNLVVGSTTISPIPGVSVSILSIDGTRVDAIFTIGSAAPLGPHSVTLTTPGGTTQPMTFTIFDPFPDLRVRRPEESLWAGLTGAYFIIVDNHGTAPANTMVVTDVLPPELTFLSGGGDGFSCSANGELVSCSYSGSPMDPLSTRTISMTVAVSVSAPSTLTHPVSVASSEDMNPSNNTESGIFGIQPVPDPQFGVGGNPLSPGTQAFVSLNLPTSLPYDMTGTLFMSFSSTALNPSDDPALQFASGGRQVPFVIRAGTTQARFGNSQNPGPIGYQAGTVAGTVVFVAAAQIGSLQKSVSSGPVPQLTIAASAPALHNIRTETQGGFAALITSSSTPRSVTEFSLRFMTTPAVQLSCGSIPGCSVSGSTLTFDVKAVFDNWFITNSEFGGLSTLRVPLSIQGRVTGVVSVTLRNALGSSNSLLFQLP